MWIVSFMLHTGFVVLMARVFPRPSTLCYNQFSINPIAKGHPGHEAHGGRHLRQMGLPEAADIVAAHQDVTPPGRQ